MKKKIGYICLCVLLLIVISFISSCSSGNKFKIDGQLLNMDQGEILVYSNTKTFVGLDTIHIVGGRFSYEKRVEKEGTIILVFPNFSEIPIFAEPGESVKLKGNAQQLSDLTVNGTKNNELFTRFRIQAKDLTPPKAKKAAEKFIKENEKSIVSVWLLQKYFINNDEPNYKKALSLAKLLKSNQEDNPVLGNIIISLEKLKNYTSKGKLPKFSTKDINDKVVNNKTISNNKTIIYTAASWDYSNNIEYSLRNLKSDGKKFNAIKISIDPYKEKIKKESEYINDPPTTICDEKMFNSPLMKIFGFTNTGENIIVDEKGNIIARNAKQTDIEKLLK